MATGPQTVIITTTLEGGGVETLGTNDLLLVAPHVQSGSLVSPNVVKRVRTPQAAEAAFGDGSVLHTGATVALQNITRVHLVGAEETDYQDTIGDASAESSGTLTSTPITSVDSASIDGTDYDIISFTHKDPATLSPTTGAGQEEIIINPETGDFNSATATSGAGAGIIIDYKGHDWQSALEAAEAFNYEVVSVAGMPFSDASYGVYKEILSYAGDSSNKIVRSALSSGSAPADVEDLVKSIRDGRLALISAYYTGDLTSAWAAQRASRPVNSTAIRQLAPAGISYSAGYTSADYGDEVVPAAGTFHEMGVNAVFKAPVGTSTFRVSSYRSVTDPSSDDRYADTRRVVRSLEVDLDNALNGLREKNDTGIPLNSAGISVVKNAMRGVLLTAKGNGLIDDHFITVPEEDDISASDRTARILDGFDVRVRLSGQVHVIKLQLNAEV